MIKHSTAITHDLQWKGISWGLTFRKGGWASSLRYVLLLRLLPHFVEAKYLQNTALSLWCPEGLSKSSWTGLPDGFVSISSASKLETRSWGFASLWGSGGGDGSRYSSGRAQLGRWPLGSSWGSLCLKRQIWWGAGPFYLELNSSARAEAPMRQSEQKHHWTVLLLTPVLVLLQ